MILKRIGKISLLKIMTFKQKSKEVIMCIFCGRGSK